MSCIASIDFGKDVLNFREVEESLLPSSVYSLNQDVYSSNVIIPGLSPECGKVYRSPNFETNISKTNGNFEKLENSWFTHNAIRLPDVLTVVIDTTKIKNMEGINNYQEDLTKNCSGLFDVMSSSFLQYQSIGLDLTSIKDVIDVLMKHDFVSYWPSGLMFYI